MSKSICLGLVWLFGLLCHTGCLAEDELPPFKTYLPHQLEIVIVDFLDRAEETFTCALKPKRQTEYLERLVVRVDYCGRECGLAIATVNQVAQDQGIEFVQGFERCRRNALIRVQIPDHETRIRVKTGDYSSSLINMQTPSRLPENDAHNE